MVVMTAYQRRINNPGQSAVCECAVRPLSTRCDKLSGHAACGHNNQNIAVTGELLMQGLIAAVIIGLVGGLFPAIRALRIPVSAALREL